MANRHLQTIDYDIVAPGHGDVGTKADIDDSTRYLEELLAAVTAGIAAGQSLDQLQQSVMMEDYKDWGQYEAWRAQNVQGTYQGLTNN